MCFKIDLRDNDAVKDRFWFGLGFVDKMTESCVVRIVTSRCSSTFVAYYFFHITFITHCFRENGFNLKIH